MRERLPSPDDIDELVSFLPRLYGEQAAPVVRWHEAKEVEPGVLTLPWPEYSPVVEEFVRAASKECWLDREYVDKDVHQMLEGKTRISRASIREIRTMLTFCIRGERFCTGHLETVIEGGTVKLLLQRLEELRSVRPSSPHNGIKSLELSIPSELRDALDSYLSARKQLVGLGVIRTRRSLEADYSEWLMARLFQLHLAPSSIQKGYDAVDAAGLKYQVKARLVASLSSSTSFDFSAAPHVFDFLLAVLLTPSLDLLALLRVAHDDALTHANRNRSTLRLRYTRALLEASWVEVLYLASEAGGPRSKTGKRTHPT